MPNPFFTVITVTYNSSQFVRDAIESILASTYTDFELIIGDDCSTDNTWDIINEYNDSRIVKYRNEINLREYPNRNKALSMARGEWVIFIDGDDLIYQHGLWYLKFCIEKYSNSSIQMIVQRGYFNNLILPVILTPEQTLNNFFFGRNVLLSGSFSSLLLKTKALKKNGWLSEVYVSGDEEIRLRIASIYPTLFINGFTSWARETPNSASSKISEYTSIYEMKEIINNLKKNHSKSNTIDYNKFLIKLDQRIIRKFVFDLFHLRINETRKNILLFSKRTIKNTLTLRVFSFKGKEFLQFHSSTNPFKTIDEKY